MFRYVRPDGYDRDVNILKSNLTVTRNNLTNIFNNFDQKLTSTQEKQLELASQIRDHGHGNKQLIDNLTSQVTKSNNDLKLMDQKMKTVQQQQIQITTRIDGHDRDIDILESNLTVTENNLANRLKDINDQAVANQKNLEVLDDKINSETEDITETIENEIENVEEDLQNHAEEFKEQLNTVTNDIDILRANFSKTINRVENRVEKSILVLNSNYNNKPVLIKYNGG